MYAMLATRPNLSISINLLSRYQANNNNELWKCIKRILRYVKGTLDYKLVYENSSPCEILYRYSDADWASFEPDRHSTSGFVFKIFNNTVTWCTKKQSTIALSSTAAEYIALMEAVKEAKWLKNVLTGLGIIISKPIKIYEDNQGCISIASNPVKHYRTKHINLWYHFIRREIKIKNIELNYINTTLQLADIFTKITSAVILQKLSYLIGIKKIYIN